MCTRFFNILKYLYIYFYFYAIFFSLFKVRLFYKLKYQVLFLLPGFFSFIICIYNRNFLFFYIMDIMLSSLLFLYLINNSLDMFFPIVGVVYNRTVFEENIY